MSTPVDQPSAPTPHAHRQGAQALAPRLPPERSAIHRLLATPQQFGFHQAVRLLRRWLGPKARGAAPALRFRNPLSLAFPASEVAALDRSPARSAPGAAPDEVADATATAATPEQPGADQFHLTPAFMGLLGVQGTLPLPYTEQILAREVHHRDGAARAFLDIFQHRAVSLFHEAWRKHRLPLQFEEDRRHQFRPMVLALAGLGQPSLSDRLRPHDGSVSDDALAFYAGLLQQRVVSARHLQSVLGDYFKVPVRIEQFVGRWLPLGPGQRSTLGVSQVTLGRDAMAGERVWQRDLRARLTLGPMGRELHRRFLPGGPGERALKDLLTLATGVSIEYEVQLCLHADEVPPLRLGGPPDAAALLGWNSFLLSGPSPQDRQESAYAIHAAT